MRGLSRSSLRAVRGVDVVLVEAAQLLGQQLGQLPALERDRPVGPAGGGERRQPAVGAARSRSGRPWCRACASVMPGPREFLRSMRTLSRSDSQATSSSALGLIRSAVDRAAGDLRLVLVESGGEQRAPRRDPGPGQVGVAGGVRRALEVDRPSPCRGTAAAASVIRRCASRPSGSVAGSSGASEGHHIGDRRVGQQQREHDGLGVLDHLALEPDQGGLAGPAVAGAHLGVDLRRRRGRRRGSRRARGRGARARPGGRPASRRARRPRRRR